MRRLGTGLLAALLLSPACATSGQEDGAVERGRTLIIEVNHTLAREGALVIWLSRENDRWAYELGRIIPPSTEVFEVELQQPQNTWILSAARATSPRIPVIRSRSFVIDRDANAISWDLSTNIVRLQ